MIKTIAINFKKEETLASIGLINPNIKNEEFDLLMNIYQEANKKVLEYIFLIKSNLSKHYQYDVINNVTYRIKTQKSILNKMKKNQYELTYKNLIQKINDIAGIRIICPFKNDILLVKRLILEIPELKILKEKDYIKNPKKSGYSGYHIIVEIPINIEKKFIFVKVEIQIRTMAMDFWSTTEHKIRYKTKNSISFLDSKKLSWYAKIINILDNKIMKIYQKQI